MNRAKTNDKTIRRKKENFKHLAGHFSNALRHIMIYIYRFGQEMRNNCKKKFNLL